MRPLSRVLLSLPFLLIAFGMAAGCHSTIPSLLLTIEDPTGLEPTQLKVSVSVEELETHHLSRPEVPNGPLASPQTLRLFMPDEAVGRRVDLKVEALRDGVVVGDSVTVTVLKAVEDTELQMALVPSAAPEVCDATTCPLGCCDGNVCIQGDVAACGAGGGACNACDATTTDQCVEGACRCGADAPCPAGYQCEDGACAPSGEGQSCTVSEQCNRAPGQCFEEQGTCGEDGKCHYPFKPETADCSDGDSCTVGDQCDGAGRCIFTPMVCDGTTRQCLDASSGRCENGSCRYDAKPPNTGCNDSNACTDNDRCDGNGTCKGTPKSCTPPNDQCYAPSTCDSATGNCVNHQRQEGFSCDDGKACTVDDACNASGVCSGTPKVCTTSNPCKQADCQNGNCVLSNKQDGTVCGSVDTCSHEVCEAGQCVTKPRNVNQTCNDGEACTVNDTCKSNGVCSGTPKVCTTSNPCKQADCQNGNCVLSNKQDGTVCGSEDTCSHQVCQSGQCVTKARNVGQTCAPTSACREYRCTSAGQCGSSPINEGEICNMSCGTCSNGTCGGGCPSGMHCCGDYCEQNGRQCR